MWHTHYIRVDRASEDQSAVVSPTDENQGMRQASSTRGGHRGTVRFLQVQTCVVCLNLSWREHTSRTKKYRSVHLGMSCLVLVQQVKRVEFKNADSGAIVCSLDSEPLAGVASIVHTVVHTAIHTAVRSQSTGSCCPSRLCFHYLPAEVRRLPSRTLLLCIHAAQCNHAGAQPQSNSAALQLLRPGEL